MFNMYEYMYTDTFMRGAVSPDKGASAKRLIEGDAIRNADRPDRADARQRVKEQPARSGQMHCFYLHTSPWTISASMCDPRRQERERERLEKCLRKEKW